jgi:hypothetical protein
VSLSFDSLYRKHALSLAIPHLTRCATSSRLYLIHFWSCCVVYLYCPYYHLCMCLHAIAGLNCDILMYMPSVYYILPFVCAHNTMLLDRFLSASTLQAIQVRGAPTLLGSFLLTGFGRDTAGCQCRCTKCHDHLYASCRLSQVSDDNAPCLRPPGRRC